MFKKLRNKFLIMDMITISALLIICFAVISVVTWNNVASDIEDKVVMLSTPGGELGAEGEPSAGGESRAKPRPNSGDAERSNDAAQESGEQSNDVLQENDERTKNIPPNGGERPNDAPEVGGSPAENEETNPERRDNSPRTVPGRFIVAQLTDGEYSEQRLSGVFSDGESDAVYELGLAGLADSDETQFTYNGNSWYAAYSGVDNRYIVMLDISTEIHIIHQLMLTFVAAGLIGLLIIFFISLQFANRTIAPIAETWDKQKQFIADASHELKTPLAAINTNLDVLLSDGDMPEENSKWLQYIRSETERMTKLTNDLLYLARLDYKKEEVVYSEISFSEICQTVVMMMEARAFEKMITISDDIADGIMIRADGDSVRQVVMVLIDNAIKYTPENGTISVKLTAEGRHGVLRVTNSGTYIDSADLEHIFDRFYRSDKARTHSNEGGFGLGLAIAKAAVTRMGGKISASSDKKTGTEFTVSMPKL